MLEVAAGKRGFVEVYGEDYRTRDGTCVRDYIHVVDLAHAHLLAIKAIQEGSRIYNLGCGGKGYSVQEVIDTAREVTGKKIPLRVGPRRPGDPATLVARSEKIKRELARRPQHQDLAVIIESAWRWMLAHPNGYAR